MCVCVCVCVCVCINYCKNSQERLSKIYIVFILTTTVLILFPFTMIKFMTV